MFRAACPVRGSFDTRPLHMHTKMFSHLTSIAYLFDVGFLYFCERVCFRVVFICFIDLHKCVFACQQFLLAFFLPATDWLQLGFILIS